MYCMGLGFAGLHTVLKYMKRPIHKCVGQTFSRVVAPCAGLRRWSLPGKSIWNGLIGSADLFVGDPGMGYGIFNDSVHYPIVPWYEGVRGEDLLEVFTALKHKQNQARGALTLKNRTHGSCGASWVFYRLGNNWEGETQKQPGSKVASAYNSGSREVLRILITLGV